MLDIIDIEEETGLVESESETALDIKREQMSFEKMMEIATMLSKSTIVPTNYQNRPENIFVAIDMANRTSLPVMSVMQNLWVIQGKPSWSGQAIATMVRNSRQFKNVELHFVGTENTDSWGAYVTAIRTSNGKELKGATVTIGIAKREGWYQKTGSKWQTIPELMLSYRAYAWFGRVYAPELMLGMLSSEEVEDVEKETVTEVVNPYTKGE